MMMVIVVSRVFTAASAPTLRISRNMLISIRPKAPPKLSPVRPDRICAIASTAPIAKASTTPMGSPAMPSAGRGPHPRAKPPDKGIEMTDTSSKSTAGVCMSPVPRIMLSDALHSQIAIQPGKKTSA